MSVFMKRFVLVGVLVFVGDSLRCPFLPQIERSEPVSVSIFADNDNLLEALKLANKVVDSSLYRQTPSGLAAFNRDLEAQRNSQSLITKELQGVISILKQNRELKYLNEQLTKFRDLAKDLEEELYQCRQVQQRYPRVRFTWPTGSLDTYYDQMTPLNYRKGKLLVSVLTDRLPFNPSLDVVKQFAIFLDAN